MKKVLSLFMAVVMLFSLTAGIDFSASANVSGDYEYTVLDDGTAEITSYNGSATDIIIPSALDGYTVSSIGYYAFSDSNITNITIPKSVIIIEDYAFWKCRSLTNIYVDSENPSYCSIDGNLFNKDKTVLIQYSIGKSETEYVIPDSIKTIGTCSFLCSTLNNIIIPNSVIKIEESAFYECENLINISIPESVTSIEMYAFQRCFNLKNINVDVNNFSYSSIDGNLFNKDKSTLIQYAMAKTEETYAVPNTVTIIEDEAFLSCVGLKNITIPSSTETIGYRAFDDCFNLISIDVDINNPSYCDIDGSLFDKDKTTLIQYAIGKSDSVYEIPYGIVAIEDGAFAECWELNNVIIPQSVSNIGGYAFGCCGLTNITIPNSVITIEDDTFSGCGNLMSVTIGDSVTKIGDWAFAFCDKITDVYYSGTKDEWNEIFIGDANECLTKGTIHCIDGVFSGKHNHTWDNGAVTLNPTCTQTGVKTFTCTTCGESYTEQISATGHNFGNNNPSCFGCGIANPYYVAPTQPAPPITQVPTAPSTTENTTKKTTVKKPKTESIKKLSKGKKSFKVYWKKLSGVTGYQVQYSTDKRFKKNTKTVTVKGYKNTSKIIKKLKGNKKYYVRVRAYNKAKVNGKTKTAYGTWSKVKTVVPKK